MTAGGKARRASAGQEIPTVRARRPITIHDLLRHTSGFTYGDLSNTVVDQVYRERNILYQPTLEDMMAVLGEIPLLYQPGTRVAGLEPRVVSPSPSIS